MLKILAIEDHALVREGLLQTLCNLEAEVQTLGAQNADEALALLESNPDLDLVLLDLMLPGTSGLAFLTVLRKRFPTLPVVVISALDDAETVSRAMRGGAAGFVPKTSPGDELLGALRQVLAGEIYVPDALQAAMGKVRRRSDAERFGLTPGQSRVLDLLAQGKTNRQIADMLGLTEGTVKIHVSAILKALNVTNRSQALLTVNRKQGKRV